MSRLKISSILQSAFGFSFCLYTFYCLTTLLRGQSAIGVQMPIVMFCFFLLLISKGRRYENYISVGSLAIVFVVFNFIFFYLQGGTGGDLQSNIGANFTLFNIMFPILLVASGGFAYMDKQSLYKYVILITIATCLTTIAGTYIYDYPCRELATPNNPELDLLYKSKNIGGYGFVYYLLLLIPILIKRIRENRSKLDLIALGCSVFCIIRSEYTTALLVMFVTFCAVLFIISDNFLIRAGAVVISIAVLFFSEQILIWAGSFFGGSSYFVEQRINMMLDYNATGTADGDMAERQDLYMLSLMSFLSNPLFGGMFSFKTHVGGHSEILDFLGHSGLFGLFFLKKLFDTLRLRTPIREMNFSNPYTKLMFGVAISIASVNTFLSPELTFGVVILPMLANSEEDL